MVIIQSALLLFGLFVCPLSESRSKFYINFMPEFKHYNVMIAELIFPIIIFILCLWGMLSLPKEDGGDRLYNGASYLFVLLNQVSIILWFYFDFYTGFNEVLGLWVEERKVILMIKASLADLPTDVFAQAKSSVVGD